MSGQETSKTGGRLGSKHLKFLNAPMLVYLPPRYNYATKWKGFILNFIVFI